MNTKKFKTIIGCTLASSAVICAGTAFGTFSQNNYDVSALGVDRIAQTISNQNFNESTKTSYPYSPSSFSAYNQNVKVSSSSDEEANVTAGIINLKSEKYRDRFSSAYRSSLDEYVLMIDSTDEDNHSIAHTVNYGFRTNDAITLDANSKYMFTVDVYASAANIATLNLYDKDGKVFDSIDNITTINSWSTHTFLVATNNIESIDLTLGINLEGAGTVLFDNISCYKLSDTAYDYELTKNKFSETNLVNNILVRHTVASDKTLGGSALTKFKYELSNSQNIQLADDSDGQNSYALKLAHTTATYTQYKTNDDFLTFAQNRIYKVNVNVKTKNLNGEAFLRLVRTDIPETDAKYNADEHNKTITISSSTYSSAHSITNDYTTYSFLINSHSSKDVQYRLEFGLGTEENATSGEMYVSEVEVSYINYSTFDGASTGSGVEKINFVDAYKGSDLMLDNGDFNAFEINDYNSPMPATATDWTVTTGTHTQNYGVVNTKTFETDLSKLNLTNPKLTADQNNNILMMHNQQADTLSYTSASKKLTRDSYHKYSIDVFTQGAPLTISLATKNNDEEIILSSKEVDTNASWQTVNMFIHTGKQNLDVYLKLTLTSTSSATAYVDDAEFDFPVPGMTVEDQFNAAGNATYTSVIDLNNILHSDSNNKYANATFFKSSESNTMVETGTVTLNSTYLDEVIDGEANRAKFNEIAQDADKKAVAIWSTDDVHHSLTSTIGYTALAEEGKYYKLSLKVFTQGISSNNAEADVSTLGAGIKLSGFENSFTAIKSENRWTSYTFYIRASSEVITYLELSLGSEDALTKGAVFFTDIEFSEIEKSAYEAAKDSDTTKIATNATTNSGDESESTTTETKKQNRFEGINWWLVISGSITGIALLIAIVGVLIRKIKWKKPRKKSKNTYDRNKTVSVQYYTRKATIAREEKIRELSADLEKINAERKQFEDDYKQDLTKLREMKIKRANPSDIAKLEKDMKKQQKMSASLGVTANRINEELKYVQTTAYLNSLIKQMSREPNQNREEK